MNVTDLEHALAAPAAPTAHGRPDLAAIRRAGARRRRTRRAVRALTVAAAGALAAGVLGVTGGAGDEHAIDPAQGGVDRTQLSDLAQQALEEIPGARKINSWQVLVPGPGSAPDPIGEPALTDERFAGEGVAIGEWYAGVTSYERDAFPSWLWRGAQHVEQTVLGDKHSYPVGSTDTGVVVDAGQLELACMTAWDWNKDVAIPGRPCSPAVVGVVGGERRYLWGIGTDDFLDPGAGMELFDTNAPAGVDQGWIGGVDGTDVVRADFTTTDGTVVEGRVSPGTLVPGKSMFYAQVPGELANVSIYDASGALIESHDLEPCSDPVDCEVR